MTFRVALAAAALLTASGAAHAQTLEPRTLVDRVVVSIDGKPMAVVRAELARASEAVCRSDQSSLMGRDSVCVDATYVDALRRAKRARAATPAVTLIAAR